MPISNANSSFCSAVNVLSHFSLSHLTAEIDSGAESELVPAAIAAGVAGLGDLKKEVMELLALGFLASEEGMSVALRFKDIVNVR